MAAESGWYLSVCVASTLGAVSGCADGAAAERVGATAEADAADPAEAGMGIAAAADRGAATGSAALEEAATGCGAAAGAMTTTEPLEPAPAEAMFSEL